MIAWSKSAYRQQYPDHVVYFNANIFTEEEGKVWFGDIDISADGGRLQEVANEAGRTLYVLREMDGRFENETQSASELKEVAAAIYRP